MKHQKTSLLVLSATTPHIFGVMENMKGRYGWCKSIALIAITMVRYDEASILITMFYDRMQKGSGMNLSGGTGPRNR